MRSRHATIIGFVLLTLINIGCAVPYTVVQSTDPGPLDQACTIELGAVSFEGMSVGNRAEAQYIADKDNAADWANKKQLWTKRLTDQLRAFSDGKSGAGQVKISVNIEFIEPGFHAWVMSRPSSVRARAKIHDGGGKLLYELVTTGGSSGMGDRVGASFSTIGRHFARFFADKLAAGSK